jgi:hypothetical protein
MAQLTDYAERRVIDYLYNNTECYIGLLSTTPDDTGAGTEVTTSTSSGVRQPSTFPTAAGTGGQVTNASAINFGTANTTFTIAGFAIYDAATAGNMLSYGIPPGAPITVGAGSTVSFAAGALAANIA